MYQSHLYNCKSYCVGSMLNSWKWIVSVLHQNEGGIWEIHPRCRETSRGSRDISRTEGGESFGGVQKFYSSSILLHWIRKPFPVSFKSNPSLYIRIKCWMILKMGKVLTKSHLSYLGHTCCLHKSIHRVINDCTPTGFTINFVLQRTSF